MQLPERMPLPASRSEPISSRHEPHPSREKAQGLTPAGCCAKQCIQTPLGEVCHCVLDTPFC